MRIVIVTPARNEENFIEDTILSVKNQTIQPAAYVIVDDGSTDATADIVRKHKWVT
ncbi:MAG: glycosyltransferase family 2 protein, partial [Candidatus Thorarchaeota archaeon]